MGASGWAIQGFSGSSWPAWGQGSPQGLLLRPGIPGGQSVWVGALETAHGPGLAKLPTSSQERDTRWGTGTPTLVTVTPCHHDPGPHLQWRVLGWSWAPCPFPPHAPFVHPSDHPARLNMGPSPAMGSGRHPPSNLQVLQPAGKARRLPESGAHFPADLRPWYVQAPCRGGVCTTGQN